jgi:D-lactate dehydrogenase (cytochrome)
MDGLNFISKARATSFENRNRSTASIDALGLEFFDAYALQFLMADFPNIPSNSGCAVWLEQEVNSADESKITNLWIGLITKFNGDLANSWIAQNEKDRMNFHDFRHAVSWKVNEYITSKNLTKVGTDAAVPDNEFIDFYFDVKSLVENSGLNFLSYGHFGNSHLHLNMLPADENQHKRAKELYHNICEKAVKLGGTISAEHGIGKLKKEYFLMMYGEEKIRKMAALKKQLDPNLILGIGNLFDPQFFD